MLSLVFTFLLALKVSLEVLGIAERNELGIHAYFAAASLQ